jgi:hypothetical protein
MAGADLMTVKELLGHKTLAMTLRYSHLAPSHKMRAVDLLDSASNDVRCTKSVQKRGYERVTDLITPYFHWSRRGDLNPRPDDYELDRSGGTILAPVGRHLPALEKIGSGGDQISPRLPLLSPVWCTKSVQ